MVELDLGRHRSLVDQLDQRHKSMDQYDSDFFDELVVIDLVEREQLGNISDK